MEKVVSDIRKGAYGIACYVDCKVSVKKDNGNMRIYSKNLYSDILPRMNPWAFWLTEVKILSNL